MINKWSDNHRGRNKSATDPISAPCCSAKSVSGQRQLFSNRANISMTIIPKAIHVSLVISSSAAEIKTKIVHITISQKRMECTIFM